MNKLETKIKNFFEDKLECKVIYMLKNKYENPVSGDLFGEDIDLPLYSIIYRGLEIYTKDYLSKRVSDFKAKNKISMQCLNIKNINSLKGILEQHKSEGYNAIFKKY